MTTPLPGDDAGPAAPNDGGAVDDGGTEGADAGWVADSGIPADGGPERVDDLVADVLGALQTPALGGAIVSAEGVVAIGVAGVRAIEERNAVSVDDPWHLGSDTKAMTGALVGRLVDQGLLTWDLTVVDVWPEADASWSSVTVEMLLQHRGGVSGNLIAEHPDLWNALWAAPNGFDGRQDLVQALLAAPPDHPVGDFLYSNAGYMIAGAMLEARAETPWSELMEQELFGPLQMSGCGFGPPTGDVPYAHRLVDNTLVSVPPGPQADNPPGLGPAGTVHCPLADWAQFAAAQLPGHQLANGQGFLSAASLERLHTPTGTYAGGWEVLQRTWASVDGQTEAPVLTHAGSNTMWFAMAAVAPERGLAFLATTNAATPDAQAAASNLLAALIERATSGP